MSAIVPHPAATSRSNGKRNPSLPTPCAGVRAAASATDGLAVAAPVAKALGCGEAVTAGVAVVGAGAGALVRETGFATTGRTTAVTPLVLGAGAGAGDGDGDGVDEGDGEGVGVGHADGTGEALGHGVGHAVDDGESVCTSELDGHADGDGDGMSAAPC